MSHDPLCTDGKDPDAGPASCCGWCRFAARVRADERGKTLDAARAAVLAYADDTHQHVGMLKCWPENGDRCDITAALRVAAQRIDALRGER